MSRISIYSLLATLCIATDASASYQMFCELKGEVVSPPRTSEIVQFQFKVNEARDIEVDILGAGNPDCHLLIGERLEVLLEIADAGDIATILTGAQITLKRYDIDVFMNETDAVFRSIKYVRKDN